MHISCLTGERGAGAHGGLHGGLPGMVVWLAWWFELRRDDPKALRSHGLSPDLATRMTVLGTIEAAPALLPST